MEQNRNEMFGQYTEKKEKGSIFGRLMTGRKMGRLLMPFILLLPVLLCFGCGQDRKTSQEGQQEDISTLTANDDGPGLMKIEVDPAILEEARNKADEAQKEDENAAGTENSGEQGSNAAGGADREALYNDTADFAIKLLKENPELSKENVMISPVSILTALSMTANGARGETLSQMLSLFSPGQGIDSLNGSLQAWTAGLENTDGAKMKIANSAWFNENAEEITIEDAFLEKAETYYDAEIHQTAFNDNAVRQINGWVSDKTDGMIPEIMNQIPGDVVMYLINAAAFDAEWRKIYADHQIKEGIFTDALGLEKTVSMMDSEEDTYLEDEDAIGFIKPYKSGYSFVALLPKEGMTPEEYIKTLDGEHFLDLLADAKTDVSVMATMPKFESEYERELKDILIGMGMTDAFDTVNADFGGIAEPAVGNLYISQVLHKTYIAVDELGTKAGAVTSVGIANLAAVLPKETYIVNLDRPFVYAVIEDETNMPLFMGVVNKINN
ncbi:MAG: serpin family protein [Lachnospiraceae bacterium]|nr:serpin family protein [Lachnospiraceae bacterium]